MGVIGIDDEPFPVALHKQEPSAGFAVVAHATLDKARLLGRYAYPMDEMLNDPVLPELREDLEFCVPKVIDVCRSQHTRLQGPDLDLEVIELTRGSRTGGLE